MFCFISSPGMQKVGSENFFRSFGSRNCTRIFKTVALCQNPLLKLCKFLHQVSGFSLLFVALVIHVVHVRHETEQDDIQNH